ncbi:MAG: hypothetical protein VKP63_04015 [Cyanobacteriota bacterium]|nr:hypothetical protein [Cyanobacteriota bacterium]
MNDQDRAKKLLIVRNEGFSLRRMIRRSARRIIFSALAAIVLLASALTNDDDRMKLLFVTVFGISCGASLRNAAQLCSQKQNWGFNSKIIDWPKVEAISEGREIDEDPSTAMETKRTKPSEVVATENPGLTSKELSLPQLLLAGMGFFPCLGLPFAFGAIVWGLFTRKKGGEKLVIFGVAGPVLSYISIGFLFAFLPILFNPSSVKKAIPFFSNSVLPVRRQGN